MSEGNAPGIGIQRSQRRTKSGFEPVNQAAAMLAVRQPSPKRAKFGFSCNPISTLAAAPLAGGGAMKKFFLFAVILGFFSTASLWAGNLTPEEKRTLESKPAVVLVVVDFKTSWTLEVFPKPIELRHTETGTGFLFRPDGYLITNGHVVADANMKDVEASDALKARLRQEFLNALQQGLISRYISTQIGRQLTAEEEEHVARSGYSISISKPTLKVILANAKVLDAEIFQYSAAVDQKGKDVAILKIPGSNLPTVALGNSDNVRLQDQIMVLGYPALASPWSGSSVSSLISMESSLEPTATNGHISALKTESIGTPLLQSDVAITHGNSGGPAFNSKGEVIGLATYGAQEVQGFNFLVPVNTAMEFVRQSGVAPETGAFNKHWENALNLYDDKKCSTAIGEFDNVAQFMPGLPDAQKYRAAAVACVDQMKWYEKVMESLGTTGIVVIAAIIVLGLLAFLVFGRGGKAQPQPAMAAAGAGAVAAPQGTVQAASPPAQAPAAQGSAATVATPTSAAPKSYGRIQFTSGSLSGRSFPVTKEGLWIGRDGGRCGVVLQDDTVSGQHAWVVPADGNVVVIDKDSTNGTYLNSVDSPRISKVGLHNGDRVYLGKKGSVFTYFAS
jgi:serine protease Do